MGEHKKFEFVPDNTPEDFIVAINQNHDDINSNVDVMVDDSSQTQSRLPLSSHVKELSVKDESVSDKPPFVCTDVNP